MITENGLGVISECNLQVQEKTFHLKIKYDGNDFFYIVQTLKTSDFEDVIITSIKRGATFWDCQINLKNSAKKQIKRMIEQYITSM
jgi:hypothetical protein